MTNKKQDKPISKKEAIRQLWEMGNLEWKLKGIQKEIKKAFKTQSGFKASDNEEEQEVFTVLCSRRIGKCIQAGTMIQTTTGIKPIEDIKIGEYVYGYNSDGTISPARVNDTLYHGKKEMFNLLNNRKVIGSSTEDHTWLVENVYDGIRREKKLKDFNSRDKIVRYFVESPCGDVFEPHAYAIGALLGDGCSRQGVMSIHISSEDNIIPKKCAEILNCTYYKQNENNYTWCLSNYEKLEYRGQSTKNHTDRLKCNHYDEWCRGRYAHEKTVNMDVIKSWDRKSCLAFLAGLIDSDGSVFVTSDGCLKISYSSQSTELCNVFQFLFYQLFQVKPSITEDNRDKYKNGSCFNVNIKNNLFNKIALRELDPYIQLPRKKWKIEYSDLNERNHKKDKVGIIKESIGLQDAYDLSIENDTHMYLTADGLVTHNSYILCCWAIEICIQTPNAIIKYACPEKNQVEEIITDIIPNFILNDCPDHLKPTWHSQKKSFIFPNGSKIQIAGTNKDKGNKLRGGRAHLCIVDEAQDHNYLSYVINSVLGPTTDTTDGKIVLAGTPNPLQPQHEFHVDYIAPLASEGNLIKFDVYQSPLYEEQGEKYIKKLEYRYRHRGGLKSPEFLCEYMCEIAKDLESMVIPEFTEKIEKEIVKEIERPPYFDAYIGLDIGFSDLTGLLFCYYDFMNSAIVIEDEIVINGPSLTTEKLKELIDDKEKELYTDKYGSFKRPFLRIADNNNLILINDLLRLHGIQFITTAKDNKEAQINHLRTLINSKRIIISPKCKHLIYQLKNAKWKTSRREFAQIKDSATGILRGGHADLVDALIYIVRNIIYTKNPYPRDYFDIKGPGVWGEPWKNEKENDFKDIMHKILNIRKK